MFISQKIKNPVVNKYYQKNSYLCKKNITILFGCQVTRPRNCHSKRDSAECWKLAWAGRGFKCPVSKWLISRSKALFRKLNRQIKSKRLISKLNVKLLLLILWLLLLIWSNYEGVINSTMLSKCSTPSLLHSPFWIANSARHPCQSLILTEMRQTERAFAL